MRFRVEKIPSNLLGLNDGSNGIIHEKYLKAFTKFRGDWSN